MLMYDIIYAAEKVRIEQNVFGSPKSIREQYHACIKFADPANSSYAFFLLHYL